MKLFLRHTVMLRSHANDVQSNLKLLNVEEPAKRKGGSMVDSVDTLVQKLRNEAKVI